MATVSATTAAVGDDVVRQTENPATSSGMGLDGKEGGG